MFIWAHKVKPDGDPWTSTCKMPDKWEHFVAGFTGTITLLVLWPRFWPIWIPVGLVSAVLWEIKDAYLNPWNGIRLPFHLTGDGFSWKDMVASHAGVLVAGLLRIMGS